MNTPTKDEVVSLVLALEDVGTTVLGARSLRFMCLEAAQLIRRLRPDLAFVEENDD